MKGLYGLLPSWNVTIDLIFPPDDHATAYCNGASPSTDDLK